jgi:hypothetical protein
MQDAFAAVYRMRFLCWKETSTTENTRYANGEREGLWRV